MASLSASTRQCWTSSIASPSERGSMPRSGIGLRRAGVQDCPLGLLTRAWLRFLTGARTGHDSAQSDLNEAWEIAERGPMPLFLADIHLLRARLFGLSNDRPENYPWTSPQHDLAEARRLIAKHGWRRRKNSRTPKPPPARSGYPLNWQHLQDGRGDASISSTGQAGADSPRQRSRAPARIASSLRRSAILARTSPRWTVVRV